MARPRKMENLFKPDRIIKRGRPGTKGGLGYDNPRDVIDPHIRTKVVNTKELKVDGNAVNCFVNFSSDDEVIGLVGIGDTGWIGSINGIDATRKIISYTFVSGSENSIDVRLESGQEIGHLVLHNTTTGEEALIVSVDTTGDAITVKEAVSENWSAAGGGDTIQVNSPTVTSVWAYKYYEVDCCDFLPVNATAILLYVQIKDSNSTGGRLVAHPFETEGTGKRIRIDPQVANIQHNFQIILPIINQKFVWLFDATAATSGQVIMRCLGYWKKSLPR